MVALSGFDLSQQVDQPVVVLGFEGFVALLQHVERLGPRGRFLLLPVVEALEECGQALVPRRDLSIQRRGHDVQGVVVGRLNHAQERSEIGMLDLEAVQQFAFDETINEAIDAVFDPLTKEQREHHRHRRGERDRRRVEGFAHFGDDDRETIGHLIERDAAECRSKVNDRPEEPEDRTDGDDETDERVTGVSHVLAAAREIVQVLAIVFGRSVLDHVTESLSDALPDLRFGQPLWSSLNRLQ